MTRRWLAPAFVGLLLVQLSPAATLAWRHQDLLSTGRPVRLSVETRDPRDLLRGEYSVLALSIGRLSAAPFVGPGPGPTCDLSRSETCPIPNDRPVFVRLLPDEVGIDRVVDVSFERPPAGDLFIAGTLRRGRFVRSGAKAGDGACDHPTCLSGEVTYGVERWYGPQGRPARLDAVRRGDVQVDVRVGPDGTALLDAVRAGGDVFGRTARLW